jgi:hypothetical protein
MPVFVHDLNPPQRGVYIFDKPACDPLAFAVNERMLIEPGLERIPVGPDCITHPLIP